MGQSVFNQVIEQVQPLLGEGEDIIYIRHLLAFKELGEIGYMGVSDLEVVTCTRKDSKGNCGRGNIYTYVNLDGAYTLDYHEGTQKMWIH